MKKFNTVKPWQKAGAAVVTVLTAASLAACAGGSASNSSEAAPVAGATPAAGCPKPASITIWGIQTSASQQAFDEAHASAFEQACPGVEITYTYSKNSALKEKLTSAMAAGTPPTVFQSFGAGDLRPYVDQSKVENLSVGLADADASWQDKFLPSSLGPATFDEKIYGFPVWGAQPKLLYYNTAIFEKLGLKPPTTLDELDEVIAKVKDAGIIPIALGNKDQHPSTYWLGYLMDRMGGIEAYDKVYAKEAGAWSDPTFIPALEKLQEMGSSGAFGAGFDSIGDVDGSANALLYTDRAAMKLDGTWLYNAINGANPDFIKEGKLGYVPFPLGDNPENNETFGNAASLYSVTTDATAEQKAVAYAYFTSQLASLDYAKGQAEIGYVPALKGAEDLIPTEGIGEMNKLAYQTAEDPDAYRVDPQVALGPIGTIYIAQTAGVTNSSISPEKFVEAMNATIK